MIEGEAQEWDENSCDILQDYEWCIYIGSYLPTLLLKWRFTRKPACDGIYWPSGAISSQVTNYPSYYCPICPKPEYRNIILPFYHMFSNFSSIPYWTSPSPSSLLYVDELKIHIFEFERYEDELHSHQWNLLHRMQASWYRQNMTEPS